MNGLPFSSKDGIGFEYRSAALYTGKKLSEDMNKDRKTARSPFLFTACREETQGRAGESHSVQVSIPMPSEGLLFLGTKK